MANLLTRKVMNNMSRQYRKENGINSLTSNQEKVKVNINAQEESLLLGLMKNNSIYENNRTSYSKEIKKVNLEDLIGHCKQPVQKIIKSSSAISLEDLAKNHSK